MLRFSAMSRFKQQALNTIAHLINDGVISDLESLFAEMDKDGSGRLSLEEVRQAMGDHLSHEEIDEVFRSVEASSGCIDGFIEYREWIALNLLQVQIPVQTCQ